MNFNHYHGCAKCTTIGEWDKKGHHMSFPRIDASRRSNASFRNREDEDHHKEDSLMEELSINMVEDFPVSDALHLLDLGIMKKCLVGWTLGSFNFRTKWSGRDIDQISNLLLLYNSFKPIEIHRAIRKLDSLKHWKGLEFRTFLLYLGVVILKDFLSAESYNHFLILFCAVTLCSSKFYDKQTDLADILFREYIEQYINIYGKDSITSNVHNLCHLVDDVKRFGPLPNFSAYPFENRLSYIKKLVRNGNRPLAQIAKRLNELSHAENQKKNIKKYPYLSREINSSNKYHSIELMDGFSIKKDNRNKWFLSNKNEVVEFKYASDIEERMHIYGQSLKKLTNFFERPFKSSRIHIYSSADIKNTMSIFSLSDIKCKLFSLPYKQETVFIPLIHTLDNNK